MIQMEMYMYMTEGQRDICQGEWMNEDNEERERERERDRDRDRDRETERVG